MIAAGLLACGGGSNHSVPAEDSGLVSDVGTGEGGATEAGDASDAGLGNDTSTDAPATDGADAAPPPPCVPYDAAPPGTLLAPGAALQLWGVTSDGYAIYSDLNGVLWAAPIAGGAPQSITNHLGASPNAWMAGTHVIVWLDVTTVPSTGRQLSKFGVWSAAGGYHEAPGAGVYGEIALSPDGSSALYTANIDSNGQVGDVVASATTFTAAPTTLFSSIDVDITGGCPPLLAFAGAGAGTGVLAACTQSSTATLYRVDPAAWTTTQLMTNLFPWMVYLQGTTIFAVDLDGNGMIVPLGGAAPVPIDTNVYFGIVYPDQSHVVYALKDGTFKTAPVAGGSSVTLVESVDAGLGVTGAFAAFSPDGKHLLTSRNRSEFADLYVVDLTAPNQTPIAIDTSTNVPFLYGYAWSADGQYVVYPTDDTEFNATLNVANATTGAPVGAAYTGVLGAYGVGTTGQQFAFMSVPPAGDAGQAPTMGNIEVEDLSAASPAATLLVPNAGTGASATPGGTKIAYTTTACPQGVYLVDVP